MSLNDKPTAYGRGPQKALPVLRDGKPLNDWAQEILLQPLCGEGRKRSFFSRVYDPPRKAAAMTLVQLYSGPQATHYGRGTLPAINLIYMIFREAIQYQIESLNRTLNFLPPGSPLES